ncbi:unnamed protein product [Discosporangium mesarthrocarpum]
MMIGEPHKFFLNPNKLVFIARKPTQVDPRNYEEDSLLMREKVHMEEKMGTANANKEAKGSEFDIWKTQSQAWGCFYGKVGYVDEFTSQHSSWRKPRSRCDVTEYADRYCDMTRVSPYARKGADGASKS